MIANGMLTNDVDDDDDDDDDDDHHHHHHETIHFGIFFNH